MAITSYPFDDQAVTESQWSRLIRELSSGVVASADSAAFKVTADSTGMNVKVQPGFAILRGHAVHSTAVETLTIEAADTAARTDAVVLRLDPAANSIQLVVLKGTPGQPSPPLTQTDTGVFETRLAWVSVGASVTTVTANNITEARQFVRTFTGTWWTSTRPASPRLGDLGYNRSNSAWEFWTGTGWKDLAPSVTWASVSGKPAVFAPSAHGHAWSEISGKPSTFTPSSHAHNWADINSKPSSYPPSSHSHSWSSITSKPSSFPPSTHYHSQYLTSGSTISWANGSKKPHNNSASGSGTWYAVWVEGDGTFCRNTSSIRFKENVRDFEVNPDDVLALRPVIYDRKDQAREDGTVKEGRKGEVGLIAEEVEPHLPWLVNYMNNEVDGLRYDLLGVALVPVVQRQAAQIEALSERLAALEAAA
ncbi:tail fiber domain-containing protein [Streptomyces sp. NPDC006984]|uniref:tail fiber domain-containing protein n=1 Tax=Streptomyces sp. NPDC006984 TaxID=3155463 RepID=UPI0034028888